MEDIANECPPIPVQQFYKFLVFAKLNAYVSLHLLDIFYTIEFILNVKI